MCVVLRGGQPPMAANSGRVTPMTGYEYRKKYSNTGIGNLRRACVCARGSAASSRFDSAIDLTCVCVVEF